MKLSAAEYEIMECVWALGRPVSGMDIMRALGQEKGWKQPTVLTFLSRLVEKGLLETEKRGKLRSYTAAMTREAYKNSETRDFLAQLYGGSIQNMVDYALTIQDRAERQRCANTIINIMGNMFPHLRDVPDFKHKLWDHLAIMSGFELDIDYPYEIIRKDNLVTRPEHIPYSTARMRYRHYGHTLEILIKKAIEFPEGNEKRNLIALICNHMKKDYMAWNKDTVDDRKIAEDLYELSDGKLQMTDDIIRLMAERLSQNYRPKMNYNNNRQNNKRRY